MGEKSLVWLKGEIKSPPMSEMVRRKIGFLLRWVQAGKRLSMPDSRPMPAIGLGCHELRIGDSDRQWRVIYRIESSTVVIVDVFEKKTRRTPSRVIDGCRRRLARYDQDRE